MRTLEEIQLEVGSWSQKNFGAFMSRTSSPVFSLGPLYPLMGMVRMVGDWFSAETRADQRMMVGEVGLCLCDWAAREGFILPEPSLESDPPEDDPLAVLVMAVGGLMGVVMERHQGLDLETYFQGRDKWVRMIILALVEYSEQDYQTPFLSILDEVWTTKKGPTR